MTMTLETSHGRVISATNSLASVVMMTNVRIHSPEDGSLAKHGLGAHGLALGVDRLPSAFRVLGPIWNEAPAQKIERTLGRLVVLANDQQFLARRAVPSPRIV
jgi:hypothetical protein